MKLYLDGKSVTAELEDNLCRAVIISLFTWKRADINDVYDGEYKYGWWGDTFPVAQNDRIGSKLWQFLRVKITEETLLQIEECIKEALQWLIDDDIVQDVNVELERNTDDYNRIDVTVALITESVTKNIYIEDILNG
ncbi:MAG: phage GP46 family protein [Succinivibrio sp.]